MIHFYKFQSNTEPWNHQVIFMKETHESNEVVQSASEAPEAVELDEQVKLRQNELNNVASNLETQFSVLDPALAGEFTIMLDAARVELESDFENNANAALEEFTQDLEAIRNDLTSALEDAGLIDEPTKVRANSSNEAESTRIHEEMGRLASRNQHKGVIRNYEKQLTLKVALTSEDHLLAAHGYRGLGDTLGVQKAILMTLQVAPEDVQAAQWLSSVETNFSGAKLNAPRNATTDVLTPKQMPFAPDQRVAIQFAQNTLVETGQFDGLLPKGEYLFNGEPLHVGVSESAPVLAEVDEAPRDRLADKSARSRARLKPKEVATLDAEVIRIGEDLLRQVDRGLWEAVNNSYNQLIDLVQDGGLITYKEAKLHQNGYQAALNLGNTKEARKRLARVSTHA
ncbi:MAG: hypothetical protein ACI9QC_000395 [Oceanicoccus sp.]|jgi:hypothetical protein